MKQWRQLGEKRVVVLFFVASADKDTYLLYPTYYLLHTNNYDSVK